QNGVLTANLSQNLGGPVPDGIGFALHLKWYSSGETFEEEVQATSVAGAVSFQLALPERAVGHKVRLQIVHGSDANYAQAVSNRVEPVVGWAVTPPHRRKRHHRHRHHRHHHHHHHRHRG